MMSTLLSTITPLFRALHHHRHPEPHHRIHHHIEYGGGEWISLRHSSISLKCCPVIATRPCHRRQPPPISPEDQTGSGAHAVTFQDIKAPGTVQGVTQSVCPPNGGIPPLLLTLIPSPPRSFSHRVIPPVPPPYRESPMNEPLLPSASTPSPPSCTNAALSRGSGTGMPSRCC